MNTKIDKWLAERREVCERATPGEWLVSKPSKTATGELVAAVAPRHQVVTTHIGGVYPTNDLDFITKARTYLPEALDVIERLREMVPHDHLCYSRFCVPHQSEEIGRPCTCSRDQRTAKAFGLKED